MAYRDIFLSDSTRLVAHTEDYLHALDRFAIGEAPRNVLIVGVGNGAEVEMWQSLLGDGSRLYGLDPDPRTGELGLPILVGDFSDRCWLRGAFLGISFDIVIDHLGSSSFLWPYINPDGILILVKPSLDSVVELVQAVPQRQESWLPSEEVMCITIFPHVTIIEKRNPMVVPYMEIIMGKEGPIVSESDLLAGGAVRITIPEISKPN